MTDRPVSTSAGRDGPDYELSSLPTSGPGALRVAVTASNAGGSAEGGRDDGATSFEGPAAPESNSLRRSPGRARDGVTITGPIGRGFGTPEVDFEYQWLRCDAGGDGWRRRSTARR